MSEPAKGFNPFPGLRPFETEEYDVFFGREGQSDELVTRLGRARFLAVVGTSGSGKSSLVRAGLLPALRGGMLARKGSAWRIAVMRPGHDPVGNLALALAAEGVLEKAGGGLRGEEAEAVIEATLRRGALGLVEAARHAKLGERDNLLVVVDQFEELFRFRDLRDAEDTGAAAFVKLLIEAARQREAPVYVVLTMRSDFLGDCSRFQGLPEAINEAQFLVPRMNRDERRMAITGPAAVAGGSMSEPLVSRLLNDVGDNPDQLPILQHALMRTWEHWAARATDGEPVDLADYVAVGTMDNALSRHADEAYEELGEKAQMQSARQRVAEVIFKALTERGADNREIRRPTRLSQLCAVSGAGEDEVKAVIEVFRREGRSFLMPPAGVRLEPDTVIDISHESLIRIWGRLEKWVNEEAESALTFRRLADSALFGNHLAGFSLDTALEWRARHEPNVAWAERYVEAFGLQVGYTQADAFLDESRARRDAAAKAEKDRIAAERAREMRDLEQAAALADNERRLAETERQRAEEQADARQRELERAKDFAAQQEKSKKRLRSLTWALAVLLLLSAGAAVFAFTQRAQAKESERRAKKNEQTAKTEKLKADAFAANYFESAEKEKAAKEDAQRQRDLAEKNAREAEQASNLAEKRAKEAEAATARANSEAARANKLAEDERRASIGLKTALDRAENLKQLGRNFRRNLSDWGRAFGNDGRHEVAGRLMKAVEDFKNMADYDSAAAAYFSLGNLANDAGKYDNKTQTQILSALESEASRKQKYWPEAVRLYRLSHNYAEAGDTLISIGDLAASPKTPEARRIALPIYEEAHTEFRKAAGEPDPSGTVAAISRLVGLYEIRVAESERENRDSTSDKKKLIELYEESLEIQSRHPQRDLYMVATQLGDLYRKVEPERAQARLENIVRLVRASGDELAEASILDYFMFDKYGVSLPLETKLGYFDRVWPLYRREKVAAIYTIPLLLNTADALKKDIENSGAAGREPSAEYDRRAVEYYTEAAKIADPLSQVSQGAMWKYYQRIALQGLGNFHRLMGREREAVEAYKRALTLFEALPAEQFNKQDVPDAVAIYRRVIKYQAQAAPGEAAETCRRFAAFSRAHGLEAEAKEADACSAP